MSTRANVVVKYKDRDIGMPGELWLYHHHDGNVHGIGETVVQAVHDCGRYVEDGRGLNYLWDNFSSEFENVTGLQDDIEFLYRVTYADNKVIVVARHGGYVSEGTVQHYSRADDTPMNSAELYSAMFSGDGENQIKLFMCNIREPMSYVEQLALDKQSAVAAWRGRLQGQIKLAKNLLIMEGRKADRRAVRNAFRGESGKGEFGQLASIARNVKSQVSNVTVSNESVLICRFNTVSVPYVMVQPLIDFAHEHNLSVNWGTELIGETGGLLELYKDRA